MLFLSQTRVRTQQLKIRIVPAKLKKWSSWAFTSSTRIYTDVLHLAALCIILTFNLPLSPASQSLKACLMFCYNVFTLPEKLTPVYTPPFSSRHLWMWNHSFAVLHRFSTQFHWYPTFCPRRLSLSWIDDKICMLLVPPPIFKCTFSIDGWVCATKMTN